MVCGHIMRMEEERWSKRVFNYIPWTKRRGGRPSTEWSDGNMEILTDRVIEEDKWLEIKMRDAAEKAVGTPLYIFMN